MSHFFHFWRAAVLLIAAAPLVYYLVALIAAWRFFRAERSRVLPSYTPLVSVVKPLRGVDFASYENYASFCRQDYPEYEILFAVSEQTDPAVAVVRQLIADFPERQIRLLIGAEHVGVNGKVNSLALMAREARHEIIVM